MQPTRNDGLPRTASKSFERPYIFTRDTKTSSPQTAEKIRASPFSPIISCDQPKHFFQGKVPDTPLSDFQAGSNSYTKFDINFSLNPASIKGNSFNAPEFFVKNTKIKWKSSKSHNPILPKLISKAFDNDLRNRRSRYTPNTAYDIKSSTNDQISVLDHTGQASIEVHRASNTIQHKVLKEINSDGDSSSRSAHHEDKNKKEERLIRKISSLRIQLGSMRWKVNTLEKENQELRGLVETYKNIIAKGNTDPESSVRSKGYESEENSTTRNTKREDGTIVQPSKVWDITFHERLSNIFKTFSKYKSLYYTLESIATEACKIFDCGYARIILTNERAKKIYQESGSDKMKKEKLRVGFIEADMIEKREENIFDYVTFNIIDSIDDIKKPFNNEGKGISFPIFSVANPHEFWGAIQVIEPMHTTKHTRIKRKKGFIIKDELLLETYSKVTSTLIDAHYRDWVIKEQERKAVRYNDSMAHIISTTTHQELLEATKLRLADFFDFEHIGLLFYEPKEELLFTYDVQKKQNGKFYTLEPLKYPTNIGVSGHCMSQNIDLMAMNEPRMNKNFQPEIDNTTGARMVRNAIIALLKDEKGKKSGILQLINKKNHQQIDSKDEMVVRDLQRLLGTIVSHITKVYTTVNLSIAMKKTMKNIEDNFEQTAILTNNSWNKK